MSVRICAETDFCKMVTNLSLAVLNGVSVSIVTRPPEDFKESEQKMVFENIEYLKNANIQVILKSNIHQKFTVIDEHIVWYGSVNFLSFGSSEESIMRLDSFDIGGELLGIL